MLNFLCDVNHVNTNELIIISGVPKNSSLSQHPFQDAYPLDYQDSVNIDT